MPNGSSYEPMVLVYDKPSSAIDMLQTKLRYREGHNARRVGKEAMPPDQHIEGGHREREPCLKIGPRAVHDPLEMTDERQHREHRLDEHPVLPLAPLIQFEIAWIALRGMEGRITQDNHLLLNLPNQPLKRIICHIGRATVPPYHQAILIQQETEFAADNPAMIGEAFAADLLRTAAFADGMNELNPIRVDDTEHGRRGHEDLGPVLMGLEETKKPRPLRETGEQRAIVALHPAIECPIPHAFEGMQ